MYSIYIDDILLPITPEDIKISYKNQNSTVSLINESEFNIIKSLGLTTYQFSCIIPRSKYSFTRYVKNEFLVPGYFIEKFENMKKLKRVVDFTIITNYDDMNFTNKKVTLEEMNYIHIADGTGDLLVQIKLKDYVHHETKVVQITENQPDGGTTNPPTTRPPTTSPTVKTYTVKSGDTLYSIAKQFYNDLSKYIDIYNYNKELLDYEAYKRGYPRESGSRWIFPNTVIELPVEF